MRARPRRVERNRRQPGIMDAAFMSVLLGIGLIFLYHFVFKLTWFASLSIGLFAAVISTAFNYWLSRRKRMAAGPAAPPPPARRPRRRL